MSKNMNMTTFDGDKLAKVLAERGINFKDFSLLLKRDSSYIGKAIKSNEINATVYELMCVKLDVDSDYFRVIDPEPIVNPEPVTTSEHEEGVSVNIDYQTLKHLMACEYAIESMLNVATLSTGKDGCLFIDYRASFGIIKAYLPEDVKRRLNELREEVGDE